jgi:hypothetical protein
MVMVMVDTIRMELAGMVGAEQMVAMAVGEVKDKALRFAFLLIQTYHAKTMHSL